MSERDDATVALERELRALGEAVTESLEGHFDEITLARYLAGELPEEQARHFREHAALCRDCSTLLEIESDLDRALAEDAAGDVAARPPASPSTAGRDLWWLAAAAAVVLAFFLGRAQTEPGAVTQTAFRNVDAFALVRASETAIRLPESAHFLTLVVPAPDARRRYDIEIVASGSPLAAYRAVSPVDLELTVTLPAARVPERFDLTVIPVDEPDDRRTVHVRVQRDAP